jgi:hypothetical protein
VSSLIDETAKWWNIPLINKIFTKEKAGIICSMVDCSRQQSDRMVWASTRNGEVFIRSDYHLAIR